MGARIGAFFMAVVAGVIVADILIHPEGTKAAGAAVAGILTPTYNALLGGGK